MTRHVYGFGLVRVVDGDTVIGDLDLGVHVRIRKTIRLLGLDAPERFTADGKAATEAVRAWLTEHSSTADPYRLDIATELDRDDKYGRLLGTIADPDTGETLNRYLLEHGLARPYPA